MLCIAAFIIFLILYPILGIFSKDYRILFRKSWECMFNRITFKPCDVNLGEEIKGKLLAKIIFTRPKLASFLDKAFDIFAFLFVILSVWSLVYMIVAGVNLLVYDTCNPQDVESCALGGESCGVDQGRLSLGEALEQRKLDEYLTSPFTDFFETVNLLPDRFRNWDANNYLAENPSYYQFNQGNPVAIEIVDPGCVFCAQLFNNLKQTEFKEKQNLTYLLYPIPDENEPNGTKFFNSTLISKYVEATKDFDLENNPEQIPADWQLLSRIWENPGDSDNLQNKLNLRLNSEEAEVELQNLLREIGYSDEQVEQISQKANSNEVESRLAEQKRIVEEEVRTIKIPTIIFNGRRYNNALSVEEINNKIAK